MGACTTTILDREWSASWDRRAGILLSARMDRVLGSEVIERVTQAVAGTRARLDEVDDIDDDEARAQTRHAVLMALVSALVEAWTTPEGAEILCDLLDLIDDTEALDALTPSEQKIVGAMLAWDAGFFSLGSLSGTSTSASQDTPPTASV